MTQQKIQQKIVVLGAGSWGTALGFLMARAGHDVHLWSRNGNVVTAIERHHQNPYYFPETILPNNINASTDLSMVAHADLIFLATPAQTTRPLCQDIKTDLKSGVPLLICAKGLEQGSHDFLYKIAQDSLPENPVGVLSGPGFASDVAKDLPIAVTVAMENPDSAQHLCQISASKNFRPYASTDRKGVQLGGALKNVLAIACGICDGKNLGASAKSALMTRGFHELLALGTAMGADGKTLMGLSGLGDLILTCSSTQSRNFAFGLALGRGDEPSKALAEGALTASVVQALSKRYDIDMPITKAVNDILNKTVSIDETIAALMQRPLKQEKADPHPSALEGA